MWAVLAERKKHRVFREVWISYILGLLYLCVISYQGYRDHLPILGKASVEQHWFIVQQNILSYGATLTAFLLALGLPRLICCEYEYGTDCIVSTSEKGRFTVWRSKVIYAVIYCTAVVFAVGASGLMINCSFFGFAGATKPIEQCLYFLTETMPSMSNIAYCMLQYVFLYVGALYFSGFVLILAAITKRTTIAVFLSGLTYVIFMTYEYVGSSLPNAVRNVVEFLHRFGFSGYMLQISYSWTNFGMAGSWFDLWKPVLLVIVMISTEFSALWLIGKRRSRK